MKNKIVVDWLMVPLFMLLAFSGIMLHLAGHCDVHEIWHNRAVWHVIASVLFLILAIVHIAMHWRWYKGLIKNGIGRKSKITTALSFIFVAVTVTGFILLFGVESANSNVGLWHYKTGIVVSILFAIHIIKRAPILKNSLGNKQQN